MSIYSYKGGYPEKLPDRVHIDSGYTLTALHTFSNDELSELGFSGPIEIPSYNEKTERLRWDGSEFQVEAIKNNNCDFCCFVSAFEKSSLNTKIYDLTASNRTLFDAYIKMIRYFSKSTNGTYSIGELKNHLDAVLCNFDVVESDLSELSELLSSHNFVPEDILNSLSEYQGWTVKSDSFVKIDPVVETIDYDILDEYAMYNKIYPEAEG